MTSKKFKEGSHAIPLGEFRPICVGYIGHAKHRPKLYVLLAICPS